jgi:hypothetical protein
MGMTTTEWIIWAGNVARMQAMKKAYRALIGNPEGRRSLGGLRHRWEYPTKIDLREKECVG